MFKDVPGLTVHVTVASDLPAGEPARDETLVRCSQEIVTNAIRHAGAENVWITIGHGESGILVLGRDDGRGSPRATPGNGLLGMRERFEQLGGAVTFGASPIGGFEVEARLPA